MDYSDYQVSDIAIPTEAVRPDDSEPEVNEIELVSLDPELGKATIRMKASDSNSYIQYYMYSVDGGNTYSELMEWPRPEVWNKSDEEIEFECEVPYDKPIELRTAAYNGFDMFTESNCISVEAIPDPERLRLEEEQRLLEEAQKAQEEQEDATLEQSDTETTEYQEVIAQTDGTQQGVSSKPSVGILAITIFGIVVLISLLMFILAKNLRRLKKRNKRH